MREHDRKAVLLHWEGGRWQDTPDWRLDRHVIRLGLHLQGRVGLAQGERVVILSPPRREWLLADLAATVQGAVAVAVDPDFPAPALAAVLARIAPRVAFVAGPAELERLENVRDGVPSLETVIAFEGPLPPERAALLSEVLDLGGTLDTAERAGAFRARAREVSPDACALGYVERGADGSTACRFLSHREVTARLALLGARAPARKGDVAYLTGCAVTPGLRLALLAFAGDGSTTTAVGTPDRAVAEIAALRPHKIVAPPDVLLAVATQVTLRRDGQAGARGWIERAAHLVTRSRGRSRREILAALGGRARWVHSTAVPDSSVSGRLRDAVTIDLVSSEDACWT
jgi:long-chain acyl-CoA synthetase